MTMKTLILTAVTLGFAASVAAQQPAAPAAASAAPAAAPAAAKPEPIKHSCVKAEWPGRVATPTATKRFDKEFKDYVDCIKKFVDEQGKALQATVAQGEVHRASGNAAIDEYNNYIKDLNKQTGKEETKK
jgi:hypothetical protein